MEITLEAARVNAGFNQQEAGNLFGVHYQTIAKWEADNTRMPYEMIEKIPLIYGIPKDNIFFGIKNEFIRLKREQLKKIRREGESNATK